MCTQLFIILCWMLSLTFDLYFQMLFFKARIIFFVCNWIFYTVKHGSSLDNLFISFCAFQKNMSCYWVGDFHTVSMESVYDSAWLCGVWSFLGAWPWSGVYELRIIFHKAQIFFVLFLLFSRPLLTAAICAILFKTIKAITFHWAYTVENGSFFYYMSTFFILL